MKMAGRREKAVECKRVVEEKAGASVAGKGRGMEGERKEKGKGTFCDAVGQDGWKRAYVLWYSLPCATSLGSTWAMVRSGVRANVKIRCVF